MPSSGYSITAFCDEFRAGLFEILGVEAVLVSGPADLEKKLYSRMEQKEGNLFIVFEDMFSPGSKILDDIRESTTSRLILLPDHVNPKGRAREILRQAIVRATGSENLARDI